MGGQSKQSQQQAPLPVDTKDNLRSRDKFEIMLALCHGPIKGPTQGFKSIRFNDTPFLAADGSQNFTDAELRFYQGNMPGETIRPVLGGLEDWRGNRVTMQQGVPVEFTTQTPTSKQIILRFRVKKLYRRIRQSTFGYESDGTGPNSIELEIRYRDQTNGTMRNPINGNALITGRAVEDTVHEVRLVMANDDAGPYTIRVTSLTPDTEEAPCQFELEGYYEVQEGKYGLTKSNTVNVQLAPSQPVVRTTQAPPARQGGGYGIDMIDLRFVVQQLFEQRQPTEGDPGGTFEDEIELLVEVRRNSFPDTWRNPFGTTIKIKGKTTTPVVFEYRVLVPMVEDRWDVRVTRVSGEVPNRIRVIQWESFQEVVGGPVRFDGVAVLQAMGRATAAFSSYPEISGEYDLKFVKVPVNYDPVARTYSGTWDGQFKWEWTDNPVWQVYDLAMDDFYGARRFWPELDVDRMDCYEAAKWCDELVPDGRGGWQPRYRGNLLIDEARGIRDQLRYMAGAFNAILVDDLNGRLRLFVDKDDEATAIFGPENVVEGVFNYTYSDPETRYNDVTAKFANAERDYEMDTRRVFDASHQGDYGVIPYEFAAVGCTNAHEAVRRAAYKLISATTETETVSFKTNRRALFVQPFDVILVADPDKGHGLSGRIAALESDRRVVRLSQPLYLEAGVAYQMHIDCKSGVKIIPLVSNVQSWVYSFEVAQPVPLDAPDFAFFTLGSTLVTSGAAKPYRVMRLEEEKGNPDEMTVEAIEINRNKYLLSDAADDVAGLSFIGFPATVAAPTNVQVVTDTVLVNAEPRALAVVTWAASTDPRVTNYIVEYKRTGMETWIRAGITRTLRFEIYDVPDGVFDVRVGAEFGGGVSWMLVTEQAMGLTAPPSDVAQLSVTMIGDNLTLTWPPIPDRDLSHYYIRFTPITGSSASWANATDLLTQVVGTSVRLPLMQGTFFIKAVDTSGVESRNAASTASTAMGVGMNAVWAQDFHPSFPGTKTGCYVETGLLKGAAGTSSSYIFESTDFGQAYTSRVSLAFVGSGERPDANMIFWQRLSDLETISNVDPKDYTFTVEMQISLDGTTWDDWRLFSVGDYLGRKFRWRITLTGVNPLVTPVVMYLRATVDMPDRVLSGRDVIIPSSGRTIFYVPSFREPPTLGITGKDFATGDYFTVDSESISGFTLTVRNSSGTPVSRRIDWIAVGYGYGYGD